MKKFFNIAFKIVILIFLIFATVNLSLTTCSIIKNWLQPVVIENTFECLELENGDRYCKKVSSDPQKEKECQE